jgi:ATP-dependent helicase/nuclease subunit B
MRHDLKLPSLENSIGLSAHDFVQAFCAKKVIITRSKRINNAPAVPSRWLQKLDTVLEAMGIDSNNFKSNYYNFLLNHLDSNPEAPTPCSRAQFSPPLTHRPKELSVTQIETLMHDPYSIYAYKVLKLKKLKPLDEQADASIRGTIIHDTLDEFINNNKNYLPENPFDQLESICRNIIDQNHSHSINLEFWWPRFTRAFTWFSEHEKKWRASYTPLYTEETGSVELNINEVKFTLKAKADRIDVSHDGSLAIIDYKTGLVPSNPDIMNGFKPQMPLEGLIAMKGGFEESESKSQKNIEYLGFWIISGGADPGKEKPINIKNTTIEGLIENSEKGLIFLLETFLNNNQPFISLPRIDKAPPKEWRDYDHLARVSEWADIEEESTDAA